MLIFVEAGRRIMGIFRSATLAYSFARDLSKRRPWVFVHTPHDVYVFHRGVWLQP